MAIFDGLTPAQLSVLADACQVRRVAKGERVYHQGDEPRALYHLLEGEIKRAIGSAAGVEKVLEIVSPVQSFGASELFGARPYACFAEAVRPSLLLQIDRNAIHRTIEQDPQFALRMLGALADRHAVLERDAAARHLQNGSARLMEYLLDLAGSDLSTTGDTMLELQTSKQLIAARLDLTPETLSRAFRSLSDARRITVDGKRVTLHRPSVPAAASTARGVMRSAVRGARHAGQVQRRGALFGAVFG